LVAHRGLHGSDHIENTLPAFDGAVAAGAWGIECDVRWTSDRIPVVCHDLDCRRLFGVPVVIANTEFTTLRELVPQIPSLEEVMARYRTRAHLMIELKNDASSPVGDQFKVLRHFLEPLVPAEEYHVLADNAELLETLEFLPTSARLALARTDARRKSQLALAQDYGGLLGHYALLPTALVKKHTAVGQAVGTGFVASRNCFFREVTRGVRWVFTNNCAELTQWRDQILLSE
jgi:glycerophosphoryl diester phosphodiesterase